MTSGVSSASRFHNCTSLALFCSGESDASSFLAPVHAAMALQPAMISKNPKAD